MGLSGVDRESAEECAQQARALLCIGLEPMERLADRYLDGLMRRCLSLNPLVSGDETSALLLGGRGIRDFVSWVRSMQQEARDPPR